jgi:hypothetical protein
MAQARASDDGLHDLRGAVADLKTENVAQPLLHHPTVVAAVPEHQQALVISLRATGHLTSCEGHGMLLPRGGMHACVSWSWAPVH